MRVSAHKNKNKHNTHAAENYLWISEETGLTQGSNGEIPVICAMQASTEIECRGIVGTEKQVININKLGSDNLLYAMVRIPHGSSYNSSSVTVRFDVNVTKAEIQTLPIFIIR